jgi:hypothetical protein
MLFLFFSLSLFLPHRSERERKRNRKRGRERKREGERKKENFFKGMAGALAPFSYLVF